MLYQLSYFRVTFGCHVGTDLGLWPWHTGIGSAARTGGVITPCRKGQPVWLVRRVIRQGAEPLNM
ncbi:hypothetical protein [Nioella ostreopsis]|uniref:hypothetical protein n=1 Tax=Nioella ostreopsis TaxID=2448479 RepID=UPI000FDC3367|nr:hypothetical protein [Nioella ostreopsis]